MAPQKIKKCRVYLACATGHPASADISEWWFYVANELPVFVAYDQPKPHKTAVPCCVVCRYAIRLRITA